MFELLMLLTLFGIVVWSLLASPDTNLRGFCLLVDKIRAESLSRIRMIWNRQAHAKLLSPQLCRCKWIDRRHFHSLH